jgi:hypothetical protein
MRLSNPISTVTADYLGKLQDRWDLEVLADLGFLDPAKVSFPPGHLYWSERDEVVRYGLQRLSALMNDETMEMSAKERVFVALQDFLNHHTRELISKFGFLDDSYDCDLNHPFWEARRAFITQAINDIMQMED